MQTSSDLGSSGSRELFPSDLSMYNSELTLDPESTLKVLASLQISSDLLGSEASPDLNPTSDLSPRPSYLGHLSSDLNPSSYLSPLHF